MLRRATFAVVTLALMVPIALAATGPFAPLAGTWSGEGSVSLADGNREALRCRAVYDVGGGGTNLRLELRCASESYKLTLAGEAEAKGAEIAGSWTEVSQNASGTLSGRASSGRIEAVAKGEAFSANLALTTKGRRQSVAIRPQGATEVTAVDITLSKR